MGQNFSQAAHIAFEITNELYTAVASGLLGIAILTKHGIESNHVVGTIFITLLTGASLVYVFNSHELSKAGRKKVVLITGCDSGLGYSLAQHLYDMGYTVLAGCLSVNSEGAQSLQQVAKARMRVFELDVTDVLSVGEAVRLTKAVLHEKENNVLWAVINNAGVMVFGEFEWQTENLSQLQIDVNLVGTLRVTKAFCALLRKYKGRVINVSSHCALTTLPGLTVYGATKAAIQGFSDALRIELRKYGVNVITFIPGSFTAQSNIMAKQMDYVYEMRSGFTNEQEEFYGNYFIKYNSYLSTISMSNSPKKINDSHIYEQFEHAITSRTPKARYISEPYRYKFYHALFKISPTRLRDYFVQKFMQMPEYEQSEHVIPDTIC